MTCVINGIEQSVSDQLKGLRVLECLLDCKTVGFFFSKSEKNSVKRGVRVLRARASHARRACEARAVKPKVWNEAEDRERDWGETLKIRTVRFAYVIFVQITRLSQPRAIPIG